MDPGFGAALLCSDDFLTLLPGMEECQEESKDLKVFWYPEMNNSDGSLRPISSGSFPAQPQSIPDKIKSLLLSLGVFGSTLVQFWAPVTTKTGQTVLSVVGQPFGVSQLYIGFCRYRYHCIQQGSSVNDVSQLGHLGRAFLGRSSEVCDDIESGCTIDEFPMKEFAKNCGIISCRVVPLFEPSNHRDRCIGVLELVSLSKISFSAFTSVENEDFLCTRPHCQECEAFYGKSIISAYDLLATSLYRVQKRCSVRFWVPCICDDEPGADSQYQEDNCTLLNAPKRISQFFCEWPLDSWDTEYELDRLDFERQTFFLRNGKSWVERAHSLNKLCFISDTSPWTLSDYPIGNLRNFCRFAIPLKLIHTKLPPVILEVLWHDFHMDVLENSLKDLLKDILDLLFSEFARRLSKYKDITFGTKKFSVEFSHHDVPKYVYFDVSEIGNGTEQHFQAADQPLSLEDNVQYPETDTTIFIDMTTIPSSTKADAQINATHTQTDGFNAEAETFQSHDDSGDGKLPDLSSHHDQQTTKEAGVHHTNKEAMTKKGVKIEIDYDRIEQCSGRKVEDAARELGGDHFPKFFYFLSSYISNSFHYMVIIFVKPFRFISFVVSRSTLKRRCRDLGIKRWSSHKKNKAHYIPEKGSTQTHSMIVKATYREDAVKFDLGSTSAFGELVEALKKRFDLVPNKFKIKYEDKEDGWIKMACDEDLHFHLKDLISAGETRMNLKVFPETEYVSLGDGGGLVNHEDALFIDPKRSPALTNQEIVRRVTSALGAIHNVVEEESSLENRNEHQSTPSNLFQTPSVISASRDQEQRHNRHSSEQLITRNFQAPYDNESDINKGHTFNGKQRDNAIWSFQFFSCEEQKVIDYAFGEGDERRVVILDSLAGRDNRSKADVEFVIRVLQNIFVAVFTKEYQDDMTRFPVEEPIWVPKQSNG
ncbi:OLC1v1005733C1 [Oldenlandia corymbosa var. corymbosa]|uniref:OLC1v1005733C1 n=1 Tax=Oldenlandia corymbosa var. corymbosa TaxID=529605 RepID=A0AAV1DFD3_OLDCO|nr:OLC1v1005733C1 [Oldenlandia corymbosa var. corymbosa]